MSKRYQVAFAGNPNCGKTSLFNEITGAKFKVANWPGVTVERKESELSYHGADYCFIDLPGLYSLNTYTMEEKVSSEYLLGDEVDLIVNIVDASSLEKSLYLTLQLLELGKPVVVALNMIDVIKKRKIRLDMNRLSALLGVPVVGVSAKKGTGMEALKTLIEQESAFGKKEAAGRRESFDANEKYDTIERILSAVMQKKHEGNARTDRIDKVVTHPVLAIPIFLLVMAAVFALTFTVGDWLKVYFSFFVDFITQGADGVLTAMHVHTILKSIIVDGILSGVGGIITFLPNIMILFLALAVLEDSGYMSRVAYIMNGIMGKIGLSGRAFIPMLLGFGCSVPAVMASRTLENRRDRIKTIMITPFMSCSARLPLYVLISQIFFEKRAALAAYSMYLIGIVTGIAAALIMHKFDKSTQENTLLIEFPEYRLPTLKSVLVNVWEKVKEYLTKAGTTILLASVAIWILMNFGVHGMAGTIEESFAAALGKQLIPLFSAAGLGYWQIIVSLISGVAAKEVVVSSMGVLFGIGNVASAEGMGMLHQALSAMGFTWVNGYSLMLFSLLYIPCVATLSVIRRETKSHVLPLISAGMHFLIALLVSSVFYQIVSRII